MPDTLRLVPWSDPVIDTLGHDPRSHYVETFWLPTLGPTCVLLLRHLADRFDRAPGGLTVPVADTSRALGLGERAGASSPIMRSLARLAQFDLATETGPDTVAVRRHVPPVNRRHVRRLPPRLQAEHTRWVESQLATGALEQARRRSRRVAYTLLEQGADVDEAERGLASVGFHPSICRESTLWARDRLAADVDHPRTDGTEIPAPTVGAAGPPPDPAAA